MSTGGSELSGETEGRSHPPETIAAFERADAMIEQSEALGERPEGEDALLRFSVLYGRWTGNHSAGNLAKALEVAKHFLVVAERQRLSAPLLMADRVVVVGDLIGSGEAQERGIVGETPNLAARLQGIAEPNMVVIADGTRKLLGNLFELQDLGLRDLKGIAGPAQAWAALRTSSAEGRFEAMHATDLTALVGREEELELLLRRWSMAKTGEGQVVCSPARLVSANRG